VPQTHVLGAEAEVDFGEFHAWLDGVWTRLWLFVMRLSASGKAFHHVFGNQCGESFYEGHNLAFDYFGGVPGTIRYDNLKPAVVKVLLGRDRWENTKFIALRSHYGYNSFFCIPGIEGAHEKGGVEGEIGRFRRRHLVPVPRVESLDELNAMVAAADVVDDDRVISGRPLINGRRVTVGEHFALEQPTLKNLVVDPFDVAVELECRVDHKARICVRQAFYSVPVRLAGSKVRVRLGASHLEILDGTRIVARHIRALHKGVETLTLDHYLEILTRKPGALPGATALAQARAAGTFTDAHQRFWDAARRHGGDQAGTRALIEILLQHRRLPTASIIAALEAVNRTGIVDPMVVVVEARRHNDQRPPADVTPIGALERYDRPAPSVGVYDQLLTGEPR
jgi:Mu transposase, C-terminal domain